MALPPTRKKKPCTYPQYTNVAEFLDDGTLNPQRCPYQKHWNPYRTLANNLCCKKSVVRQQERANLKNKYIRATHAHFSDEPPSPSPQKNGFLPMKWGPNRSCPENSQCTEANCLRKNGRRRVCSDKYRCVLEDGAAGIRSCRAAEEVGEEKYIPPNPAFLPPPDYFPPLPVNPAFLPTPPIIFLLFRLTPLPLSLLLSLLFRLTPLPLSLLFRSPLPNKIFHFSQTS